MPFRRRPPEPSPRLRALLDGAGAGTGAVGAAGSRAGEVVPRTGELVSGADEVARWTGEVVPWVPERAWLELPVEGSGGGSGEALDELVVRRPGRHRRPRPPGPRLLTVPESLRGARLTAPRLAAVGLLLVLAVAAVGFGARVAWARAASQPRVVAPAEHGSAVAAHGSATANFTTGAQTARGQPSGGAASAVPATTAQGLTVHVVGQVRHPGVLRLPAGSRVTDAIERAGGATAHADLSAINLARPLVDGEQVRVPKPGEAVPPPGAAGPGGADGGTSGASAGRGLVNLNTASQADLEELPGVGPVLAQRILDWRTEHGRFTTVDELGEVSGIGEKTFAQLQPKVTV
jgi:comEA protein